MNILARLLEARHSREPTFSLEFFVPDDTVVGVRLLQERIARYAATEPLFIDIAGLGTPEYAQTALPLCQHVSKACCAPALLHAACGTMQSLEQLTAFLQAARAAGVCNVLIESGDLAPTTGASTKEARERAASADSRAASLRSSRSAKRLKVPEAVSHTRRTFGDYFCIGVVGYPSGRGDCGSYEDDLAQLRACQDGGANFVLAQHVNEARTFLDFRDDASRVGVRMPIVPSVVPAHDVASFLAVNAHCGVALPAVFAAELLAAEQPGSSSGAEAATGAAGTATDSAEAVPETAAARELRLRAVANRAIAGVARVLLLAAGDTPALHVTTLNTELAAPGSATRALLQELRLCGPGAPARRRLPWRQSADEARRAAEDVRPIFWANRVASYLERTAGWETFPSGRWGSAAAGAGGGSGRRFKSLPAAAPSGGGEDGSDTPPAGAAGAASAGMSPAFAEECRAMWGEAYAGPADVWEVFARYVEGRLPRLPWCEVALHPETTRINGALAALNRAGWLTINSQPRVNCAPSDDSTFGWGGPGGYVYQKAYVECFVDPAHLAALMEVAPRFPTISYQAADCRGTVHSNCTTKCAQALTWGVFPNREILQPTVLVPDAFLEWKDEAFALWLSDWAAAYDPESPAAEALHELHDSYSLVNVVDHDYVGGDIFAAFAAAQALLDAKAAAAATIV